MRTRIRSYSSVGCSSRRRSQVTTAPSTPDSATILTWCSSLAGWKKVPICRFAKQHRRRHIGGISTNTGQGRWPGTAADDSTQEQARELFAECSEVNDAAVQQWHTLLVSRRGVMRSRQLDNEARPAFRLVLGPYLAVVNFNVRDLTRSSTCAACCSIGLLPILGVNSPDDVVQRMAYRREPVAHLCTTFELAVVCSSARPICLLGLGLELREDRVPLPKAVEPADALFHDAAALLSVRCAHGHVAYMQITGGAETEILRVRRIRCLTACVAKRDTSF